MPDELPFLISGGGIGGLAAAYALARKGFPVRVLEQSAEFREAGAGIQLGPNIFRALGKLGLKDAVLADAWEPQGAGNARRAHRQERHPHSARQGLLREVRRALCGDAPPRPARGFSQRLQEQQSHHARDPAPRRRFFGQWRRRQPDARKRRDAQGPRAHRLRRHVVARAREDRRRRRAARLRPHRLSRGAEAQRSARRSVAARHRAVGRPAHALRALSAAPRRAL